VQPLDCYQIERR